MTISATVGHSCRHEIPLRVLSRRRGRYGRPYPAPELLPDTPRRCDSRLRGLAIELLCNTFPTGATVLDSGCQMIFTNREGWDLLTRWNRGQGRSATSADLPADIVAACDRLKHGKASAAGDMGGRPKFGGRIFLMHPSTPNLSAVVALERSPRDRRVAVFCILIQDRLKDTLAAGRRDQLAMLTIAERRVAKLVADGLRNGEIATALGKSVPTVKSQLSTVFAKLQVRSRTQLAALLRPM